VAETKFGHRTEFIWYLPFARMAEAAVTRRPTLYNSLIPRSHHFQSVPAVGQDRALETGFRVVARRARRTAFFAFFAILRLYGIVQTRAV